MIDRMSDEDVRALRKLAGPSEETWYAVLDEMDRARAREAEFHGKAVRHDALLLEFAKPELVDGDHDDTSVIGHVAGRVLADAKSWRALLAAGVPSCEKKG